jgi:tetratricopeptide (TPR) repeat protein
MTRTLLMGAALGLATLVSAGSVLAAATAPPPPPPSQSASSQASDSLSTAASGNVGNSISPRAQACESASKFGDFNGVGIDECTVALRNPLLTVHDQATIYTDRGAIYMQHRMFKEANADLNTAIQLDPNLANAYINRGGVMIALKRYADAISDIDHGLALNPDQPEKAYFNRAIADENLRDVQSAFADYTKASQLKPDWVAPKSELARFSTKAE